jgi:TRAP-type C4-dicarboxylate transport system permease small subunit
MVPRQNDEGPSFTEIESPIMPEHRRYRLLGWTTLQTAASMDRILKRVSDGCQAVAGLCLILAVILINVEVGGRYVFDFSTLICDEYSGYFFSVLTMLGMVYSLHRGQFLRVTFLTKQLPMAFQNILFLLAALLGCIFSVIITYQVAKVPYMSFILQSKSIGSESPLFIPQFIMPVGMAALTVEFLNQAMQGVLRLIRVDEKHLTGTETPR